MSEPVLSRTYELIAEWGSWAALQRQRRRKVITRVFRSVYVHGQAVHDRVRWKAALRLVGEDGRLSHITALFVHGIRLRCRCGRVDAVHVTGSRAVHPLPGFRPHRRIDNGDRVILATGEFPFVPLEEAVVGAWTILPDCCRKELITTIFRTRRTTAEQLRVEAARWGSFRGGKAFREWLSLAAAGCHSPIEIDYVLLVERPHGLPIAKRQAPFRRLAGSAYGDAYYEKEKLLVELDGEEDHDGDESRLADTSRDVDLAAAHGIQTLRFGGRQVRGKPAWVARSVADTLEQRRRQLGL